jgi:hypothetical protein
MRAGGWLVLRNHDASSLLPKGRRWRGAPDEGVAFQMRRPGEPQSSAAHPHPCPSPIRERGFASSSVMLGLVPSTHAFASPPQGVDMSHKSDHDWRVSGTGTAALILPITIDSYVTKRNNLANYLINSIIILN